MTRSAVSTYAVRRGTQLPSEEIRAALDLLSEEEQNRICRFRRWQDLQSGLLTALLARYMLSVHLGLPWSTVRQLPRSQYGRPGPPPGVAWTGDFNLSHSGDWIIGGISSTGRIGVDIEYVRPVFRGVLDMCFSPAERAALSSRAGDEQAELMCKLWTLKEAHVKALGVGLSYPLNMLEFDTAAAECGNIRLLTSTGQPDLAWSFQGERLDTKHQLAICTDGPGLPSKIQELPSMMILARALEPAIM